MVDAVAGLVAGAGVAPGAIGVLTFYSAQVRGSWDLKGELGWMGG